MVSKIRIQFRKESDGKYKDVTEQYMKQGVWADLQTKIVATQETLQGKSGELVVKFQVKSLLLKFYDELLKTFKNQYDASSLGEIDTPSVCRHPYEGRGTNKVFR